MRTKPTKPKAKADGNKILELAQSEGLTQEQLAKKAGYSVSSIAPAYRNKNVSIDVLECIAEALEVALDEITCSELPGCTDQGGDTRNCDRDGRGDTKLQGLATEILAKSEVTRELIIRHNQLLEDTSAEQVSCDIFAANLPIEFLYNCTEQDIDREHFTEICKSMRKLVGVIAPACLTVDEYAQLQNYVDQSTDDHYFKISTSNTTVAKASVGYVKGLPIESAEPNEFEKFLERRNRVGNVPLPPESGDLHQKPKSAVDRSVVDSFRILLGRFLGTGDALGQVKAALRNIAKRNVYFCALFPTPLTPGQFQELKTEFPELILLVGEAKEEKENHYTALDQIKRILEFFGSD